MKVKLELYEFVDNLISDNTDDMQSDSDLEFVIELYKHYINPIIILSAYKFITSTDSTNWFLSWNNKFDFYIVINLDKYQIHIHNDTIKVWSIIEDNWYFYPILDLESTISIYNRKVDN